MTAHELVIRVGPPNRGFVRGAITGIKQSAASIPGAAGRR
jgi:hypothetical protein